MPHHHRGELVGTHRKRNAPLIVPLFKMRNQVGAPMLGRYGAAAEFWSEHWDALLRRIETGAARWDDERQALQEQQQDGDGPWRADVRRATEERQKRHHRQADGDRTVDEVRVGERATDSVGG